MIRKLDVGKSHLLPILHTTWARYVRIKITWDQSEHHIAARDQSFDEQLYCLNIKRVHFANNRRFHTEIVANRPVVIQVPSSLSWDHLVLANSLKVCFVDALARWLFVTKTPLPTLSSWMLKRYENPVSLVISMPCWWEAIDMNISLQVAYSFPLVSWIFKGWCWNVLLLPGGDLDWAKFPNGRELLVIFDDFGSILYAAQFCLPVTFFILPDSLWDISLEWFQIVPTASVVLHPAMVSAQWLEGKLLFVSPMI